MSAQGSNLLIPGVLVDLFEHADLSQIALVVFGGMVIAAVLGLLVRRVPGLLLPSDPSQDGQEAYVVSGVLGLLALLMGFTFSLAINRYDQRRELAISEANAIGTAYLRAQLLEEPWREQISTVLSEYTDNRIVLAGLDSANAASELERNDDLLVALWRDTKAAVAGQGADPVTSLFIAAINDVIDHDTNRKHARTAQVPSAVYAVLLVYILISAAILGYSLVGIWARIAAIVLFMLFTLSLLLIIDIDRPLTGLLRTDQSPMRELQTYFRANPPARFDLPAPTETPPA